MTENIGETTKTRPVTDCRQEVAGCQKIILKVRIIENTNQILPIANKTNFIKRRQANGI